MGGGGKIFRGLLGALALALFPPAAGTAPAGEDGRPPTATEEREAALADVRALREKARARGERVMWEDFVTPATPAGAAAYQAFTAWKERELVGWRAPHAPTEEGRRNTEAAKAAMNFISAMRRNDEPVKLEQYRAHLAALPRPPLEALADAYAELDRILAGPRAAFALDPNEYAPQGIIMGHLGSLRQAALWAGGRARVLAATHDGDAALAGLGRDYAIDGFVEGDPTLIDVLVRIAVRRILVETLNDVCLLAPPSPAALREWADRLEALPSLRPDLRAAYTFERASLERLYFMDADWNVRNPRLSEVMVGVDTSMLDGAAAGIMAQLPPREDPRREERLWEMLADFPAYRPERQIRQTYRIYEYMLGEPESGAPRPFDAERIDEIRRQVNEQVRQAVAEAEQKNRPPDFSRIGADDPDFALVALMLHPPIRRPGELVTREESARTALAYLLRKLALRQEGVLYQWDDIPANALTGAPFPLKRENGLVYLYIDDKFFHRVPLAPGDEGYDHANPWRYGFAPLDPPAQPDPEPAPPEPAPIEPPAEPPDVF